MKFINLRWPKSSPGKHLKQPRPIQRQAIRQARKKRTVLPSWFPLILSGCLTVAFCAGAMSGRAGVLYQGGTNGGPGLAVSSTNALRGPFYFQAVDARASDVAMAISEFYRVSVLVQPADADRQLTGTLQTHDLEQALQSFAFLLGASYRRLDGPGGTVYLVGGKPVQTLTVYPSYGLDAQQLGTAVKNGVAVLGDKVVAETDEVRAQELGDLLARYRVRPALTLEVWELSVSDTGNQYVNAWLQQFQVGANVTYPALASNSNSVTGATTMGANVFQGVADIQLLLQLLQDAGGVNTDLHEKMQIVSGSSSTFQSGQVLQDVTYSTVQNTSAQLVSGISRRTVGLILTVNAVNCDGTNWFLSVNFTDGAVNGGTETSTTYTGNRMIYEGQGYFLLGSFTRKGLNSTASSVPLLASVPGLGRLFKSKTTTKTRDNVVILARPVPVGDSVLMLPEYLQSTNYARAAK